MISILIAFIYFIAVIQCQDISGECQFYEVLNSDALDVALAKEADALWASVKQDPCPTTYEHVDIPIVFHILYDETSSDQEFEVDPNQLYSKYIYILKRLNLEYNMQYPDILSSNPWQDRIGNMSITFFINKIVYVPVGPENSPYDPFNSTIIQSAETGDAPLDSAHNLDIWFIYPDPSFAAYAHFPSAQTGSNKHGTKINIRYLFEPERRTTIFTHEIGHWIGLHHVWGPNNDKPPNEAKCYDANGTVEDDYITDTPNMGVTYFNMAPTNWTANTCDEGEGDEPDMWDNLMSYAKNRNMFTVCQVKRSRDNPGVVGMRDTFRDYLQSENMTPTTFVNMFYFVDDGEECMLGDTQQVFCANRNSKHKKCTKYKNCDARLCASYSSSKFANVYEDIELISGDETECSTDFMKIDTILLTRYDEAGQEQNVFACYKKVNQTDLEWDSTIVDLELELSNQKLKWILHTAGGDEIDRSVRFYPSLKPTAKPRPAPLWPTEKPRKKKSKRKSKK